MNTPADAVIGGDSGFLRLKLTNTSSDKFSGPVSINVYVSSDSTLSSDDELITTLSIPKLTLRAGASRSVRVKFTYPSDMSDGSYNLIASVTATGTNTADSRALAPAAVTISAPFVDLAASFAAAQAVSVNPGHDGSVAVTIQNLGNVTASGALGVDLYASASQTLDSSAQFLTTSGTHTVHLKPGHSITLHLRFTAPDQAAGTYNLLAALNSSTQPADNNSSNDVAVIGTA